MAAIGTLTEFNYSPAKSAEQDQTARVCTLILLCITFKINPWSRKARSRLTTKLTCYCTALSSYDVDHWFEPPAQPIVFPSIDGSHCYRIHFSFSPPSIVSTMVMWESSQWLEKDTVWSTGYTNYRKA